MIDLSHYEAWFITGTQHLYGLKTLEEVARHSQEIAQALGAGLPIKIVHEPILKSPQDIYQLMQAANAA